MYPLPLIDPIEEANNHTEDEDGNDKQNRRILSTQNFTQTRGHTQTQTQVSSMTSKAYAIRIEKE